GFVMLGGLFLAHVTGNYVVLGASVAAGAETGVLEKLSVLPLFVAGVAFCWLVQRRFAQSTLRALAIVEVVLLAGAAAALAALEQTAGPPGVWRSLLIVCGVWAMATQAVLGRAAKLPMTTVMTGNVVQVTADSLDALRSGTGLGRRQWAGIGLVAAFAGGALAGGLGLARLGSPALLIPVASVLCASAAMRTERREQSGAA
ncbi:MAG: DUF1275 domain-containing protein, partial [Phycisphaerales bacterium]|nr:DUF1275 domain-containing protein [Phycisphaerales bacterium]